MTFRKGNEFVFGSNLVSFLPGFQAEEYFAIVSEVNYGFLGLGKPRKVYSLVHVVPDYQERAKHDELYNSSGAMKSKRLLKFKDYDECQETIESLRMRLA